MKPVPDCSCLNGRGVAPPNGPLWKKRRNGSIRSSESSSPLPLRLPCGLSVSSALDVKSAVMYTTEGSIFLASLVNSFPRSTGLGIVSGVASGATACARAAFAPVLTSVPITIPIAKVTNNRVKDSAFCCRILEKTCMSSSLFRVKGSDISIIRGARPGPLYEAGLIVRSVLQAPLSDARFSVIRSPETVPLPISFAGEPCHSESTVKEILSPSMEPFSGKALPPSRVMVPDSAVPSTLKSKTVSWSDPSICPFHFPLTSAARTSEARTAQTNAARKSLFSIPASIADSVLYANAFAGRGFAAQDCDVGQGNTEMPRQERAQFLIGAAFLRRGGDFDS